MRSRGFVFELFCFIWKGFALGAAADRGGKGMGFVYQGVHERIYNGRCWMQVIKSW